MYPEPSLSKNLTIKKNKVWYFQINFQPESFFKLSTVPHCQIIFVESFHLQELVKFHRQVSCIFRELPCQSQ